ncbi:MAG: hypothetical protein ACTHPS_22195 [Streptosporangiaceae bacterium]
MRDPPCPAPWRPRADPPGISGQGRPDAHFSLGVLSRDRPDVTTYPSAGQTCQAFATAGFRRDALEQVPETLTSLAEFLDQADNFRRADTVMRGLTEEEFLRGKERLRRTVQHAGHTARTQTRTNWLDLLVLR